MTTLLSDVFLYINQFEKKQLYSYKTIAQNHTPLPLKIVNSKLNHTPSGKNKCTTCEYFINFLEIHGMFLHETDFNGVE